MRRIAWRSISLRRNSTIVSTNCATERCTSSTSGFHRIGADFSRISRRRALSTAAVTGAAANDREDVLLALRSGRRLTLARGRPRFFTGAYHATPGDDGAIVFSRRADRAAAPGRPRRRAPPDGRRSDRCPRRRSSHRRRP